MFHSTAEQATHKTYPKRMVVAVNASYTHIWERALNCCGFALQSQELNNFFFHSLQISSTLNMRFPALWICGLLLWIGSVRVAAWGGLFNRFSPEMLSNMAFHGGSSAHRPQPLFQVSSTSLNFTFFSTSVNRKMFFFVYNMRMRMSLEKGKVCKKFDSRKHSSKLDSFTKTFQLKWKTCLECQTRWWTSRGFNLLIFLRLKRAYIYQISLLIKPIIISSYWRQNVPQKILWMKIM